MPKRATWKTEEWREGRKRFKDPRLIKVWDRAHQKGVEHEIFARGKIIEFVDNPPRVVAENFGLKPGEGYIRIIDNPLAERN